MIIKILVADDEDPKREILTKNLRKYGIRNGYKFEIVETDSFIKSIETLDQTSVGKSYFHIIFSDINFMHDLKGGKKDDGFRIIKKAFEVSPLSRIISFSAYSKSKENDPLLKDLLKRGLIVDDFNSDQYTDDPWSWFQDSFERTMEEYQRNLFVWDIWENHQKIIEILEHKSPDEQLSPQRDFLTEFKSYLETALILIMNRNKIGAEYIINRSVLQMYHRALEIFCDEYTPEHDAEQNEDAKEKTNDPKLNKPIRPSALQKIMRFSNPSISKYGSKVNWYRNMAMHPDEGFMIDEANLIYACLTIFLYAVPGVKPKIERIREFINNKSEMLGAKDLNFLLIRNFIK